MTGSFSPASGTAAILLASLSAGFLSGLSPCTLPTVLFVAGYVGTGEVTKFRAFLTSSFFVLGLSLTLGVLGALAGLVGTVLLSTRVLGYAIALILVLMGLWQLGIIQFNGPNAVLKYRPTGRGYLQAFLLGIPFAMSASPCTTPVTMGLLALSASKHSGSFGMLVMVVYSLGRSIPLLVVGTFTGFLKALSGLSKYQALVEKAAGTLLIGLGLYFFWKA